MTPQPLQCDDVTCYSTVLFELQELLNYINPDSPAGKIIARRYNELWELRKGCVSHSSRPAPAPQQPEPFVAMSSTDLIALSEKEWTNRAERKQPEYNKRSWISGWMDGYFSKPQQPPATTPACPYSAEEDMCLECKAHEERIAAKARREERERLLEPMEDLRKFANGEYNEADASDNEREMRIHLEYENRIWDIMKSLREGAR